MIFYCTGQCAVIHWEIKNVTNGTSATGQAGNNLPGGATAMRIVLGVENETNSARNVRMRQLYVESDR
jgi:hypothetical protein